MIQITPKENQSRWVLVGIPIIASILALLLAAIPLAFTGASILEAYGHMIKGVFGSVFIWSCRT